MNTEIILIGGELLSGKTIDTNGVFASKLLYKNGFKLNKWLVVPDKLDELVECFRTALTRSNIIITSGGVGPTEDDLTKKALGIVLNSKIKESAEATEIVQKNYQNFGREWKPDLNYYHMIPELVLPVPNPVGLAPGLIYLAKNQGIFCAPGVPHEFEVMLEQIFLPLIQEKIVFNKNLKFPINIRTKGVPEEKIFNELCPSLWRDLEAFGQVSSLPQTIGIDIGVLIEANNQKELEQKKSQVIQLIHQTKIKDNIWYIGNESIEELVVQKAKEKGIKISLAESCTGGLIGSRITDISGSSQVFEGGMTTYSNSFKNNILGVNQKNISDYGVVSEEVALDMANEIRKKTNSYIGLSTTGIAGPEGGSLDNPVGTIWIGVSKANTQFARKFQFRGDRARLKKRFSEMALHLLWENI